MSVLFSNSFSRGAFYSSRTYKKKYARVKPNWRLRNIPPRTKHHFWLYWFSSLTTLKVVHFIGHAHTGKKKHEGRSQIEELETHRHKLASKDIVLYVRKSDIKRSQGECHHAKLKRSSGEQRARCRLIDCSSFINISRRAVLLPRLAASRL